MNAPQSDSLYEIRKKIHPRHVTGTFSSLRRLAAIALMSFYYIGPWLSLNGQQLILFDLPGRKFYIFGMTFWPQDLLYLTFLLMICAYSLFLFTAVAGRLWCGYACPQTVWTEVYVAIERWVEGEFGKRIKLDAAPLSWHKFRVKAIKHTLWIILSLWTGFTFVAYFSPPMEMLSEIQAGTLGSWPTFWIFFYGFATYGNAGWMREQVCKYMCPYARFQSAMFDKDTFIVSYDEERGEPRNRRRRQVRDGQQQGDCIDCLKCVQVCPTGIDIRDGLQYECIGCSLCIDACDDVMQTHDMPTGLIRYTTENAMGGKYTKIFRPRILVYTFILIVIIVLFAVSLLNREPIGLDIIRDRNQLFRETKGYIENVYTLKIINMDNEAHNYQLDVEGIEGLRYEIDQETLYVGSGELADVALRLQAKEQHLDERSTEVIFTLTASEDPDISIQQDAKFLGP